MKTIHWTRNDGSSRLKDGGIWVGTAGECGGAERKRKEGVRMEDKQMVKHDTQVVEETLARGLVVVVVVDDDWGDDDEDDDNDGDV